MTDEAMSPLRRRMIEDMTIRKFTAKTQLDYVQRIKNFAAFLGRSPDACELRGRTQLPAASGCERRRRADPRTPATTRPTGCSVVGARVSDRPRAN
jgi:hypothetical protein